MVSAPVVERRNCWPGATRGLEKLLNIRRRTISASIQNEKDGRRFPKLRKSGRRRQTQRSGDKVRLCNTPQKSHGKPLMPCPWFARGSRVRPMDGGYLGRKGGGSIPPTARPKMPPRPRFSSKRKDNHHSHGRGTSGIEPRKPRKTKKTQNHEWTRMGTNKVFKTTKGQGGIEPRNTRNTWRKQNHEWTRMGTNKSFKTTRGKKELNHETHERHENRTTNGHE